MPASDTCPAACAAPAATSRSARSPGVMTRRRRSGGRATPARAPRRPRSRARRGRARRRRRRARSRRSAAATSATVGADTVGTSGMAYAGTGSSGSVIGSAPGWPPPRAPSRRGPPARGTRRAPPPRRPPASCPRPSTTGTTTLPNSVASRALKASSRGARAGSPGVVEVAADHDHRRALPLDLPVALDDPGDQLLPAAVGDQGARLGVRGAEHSSGQMSIR